MLYMDPYSMLQDSTNNNQNNWRNMTYKETMWIDASGWCMEKVSVCSKDNGFYR